jgi:signal transduction histidine kinase
MSIREGNLTVKVGEGRGLMAAQMAWFLPAALAILIMIASIPGYLVPSGLGVFDDVLIIEPGSAELRLVSAVQAASYLGALVSVGLAFFLYATKREDRMGLFLAYYLLGHGILFAGPIELLQPFWASAPWINSFVLLPLFSGPATMALIALFPDGRFVPPWSRWLLLAALFSAPLSLWTSGEISVLEPGRSPGMDRLGVILLVALSLLLFGAAVYIQVYRYRRVSGQTQRMQTKWVLYGIALWIGVSAVSSVAWVLALQLPAGSMMPSWLPIASLAWTISSLFLPVALTISITRYRLFEIDAIINRTLVYGALTAGVVAVYVAVVSLLGSLFQTQGDLLVALPATALVAIIFQPLRAWLQSRVNRLIFGERDDPIETLSRLGSQLETALATEDLLPNIVETIAHTLKLPYVAIRLPMSEGYRVAAVQGEVEAEVQSFPLVYQGKDIGQLEVSPRGPGLPFSRWELRLLRHIATQAGAAANAVQLTEDLQQSRRQIVTAREEERRRLRRDLHDGIGPAMAGQTLKLDAALDLVQNAAAGGSKEELAEASDLLRSLKAQTQDSVKQIRHIVYGLRPPALDDLGLVPAIRAHVSQLGGSRDGPDVVVEPPEEGLPPLPAAVELAIYRIAIEALTNAIQHAKASNVAIRLSTRSKPQAAIRLEVHDDGAGLPQKMKAGVGISSMRERAAELGGRFGMESAGSSGSRVWTQLPLAAEVGRDE